jgi:chorismate-pyruvate lyase
MLPMYSNTSRTIFTTTVIQEVIDLNKSTTLYLEGLCNKKLKVQVVSQHEQENNESVDIIRVSKLFFDTAESPLLYCKSYIQKALLTEDEYELISNTAIPLGKIFAELNNPSVIYKENITISKGVYEVEAAAMKLLSGRMYKKSYRFFIGLRPLAVIEEFFNEESLNRI